MRMLLYLLLLASGNAWSENCDLPKQPANQRYAQFVSELAGRGCFGGDADQATITREVRDSIAYIKGPVRTAEEHRHIREVASNALSRIDRSLRELDDTSDSDWKAAIGKVRAELAQTTREVTAGGVIPATRWEQTDLVYFEGSLPLGAVVDRHCANGYVAKCMASMVRAGEVTRHAELVHGVLNQLVVILTVVPQSIALTKLNEQWDFYFEHGRSQYVWELALNSALYRRRIKDDEFAQPPGGQWILLHPNAALEFIDSGQDSDTEFNAVAIVEILGYNWLRYPRSSVRGLSLGTSLIVTISPESKGERIGLGAMFHLSDKLSIGIARRDLGQEDETTWLFSADLGKLFLKANEGMNRL